MMKIFKVDAFTERAFSGNPAGVCILTKAREKVWMQHVAREMNVSETAFLVKKGNDYDLRWFTPEAEVELCGHGTLSSAHILWETGMLGENDQARFHTLSGLLTATKKEKWIELNFPATPEATVDTPAGLGEALGQVPIYVGKNKFDLLAEMHSESTVRNMTPNFEQLKLLPARGIIVTSKSDSSTFDFVSRFFAPAIGINEDPVTGSAHCCLGPYWMNKLGKQEFTAYQASKRGGVVRVRVVDDRVYLCGQAVTILRGELVNC